MPAAGEPGGPPAYSEFEIVEEGGRGEHGGEGLERRRSMPPKYESTATDTSRTDTTNSNAPPSSTATNNTTTQRSTPYQYRRGQEDGFLATYPTSGQASRSMNDLSNSTTADDSTGRGGRAPPPMQADEVRKINEERRKRMKTGGFTNFVLRWKKGGKENKGYEEM